MKRKKTNKQTKQKQKQDCTCVGVLRVTLTFDPSTISCHISPSFPITVKVSLSNDLCACTCNDQWSINYSYVLPAGAPLPGAKIVICKHTATDYNYRDIWLQFYRMENGKLYEIWLQIYILHSGAPATGTYNKGPTCVYVI